MPLCRVRVSVPVPMRRGFLHLVAIMDWYRRKVLKHWPAMARRTTSVWPIDIEERRTITLVKDI